jgi:hypothetical protein
MFMKSLLPGLSALAFFIIVGLCIAISGCIGGHYFPKMDILVSKYNSDGQDTWSTTIDSGKDDYATAIIETSDGGYAIAGWLSEKHGYPNNPRIIRLDTVGRIVWDRTLEASEVYSLAIAEAPDGGFVVAQNINNFDSGKISRIDADGRLVWNRTFDSAFKTIILTRDGRFALAGTRTFVIDGNGTLTLDLPDISTSILQASDGGFFVERSGVPESYGTLSRLDANGTWIWTRTVGSHEMGKITSLHETQEGTVEVIYTYPDRTKDKDLVMFMESEQITFGKNGTIISSMPLVAVDPVSRTSNEGYVFAAYPFPGSTAFTSFPHADSNLHLVRLTSQGALVWQRSLDLPQWVAPQSIIQTRDGGFVTLVVTGL